jgi:hypothetical protein
VRALIVVDRQAAGDFFALSLSLASTSALLKRVAHSFRRGNGYEG